MNDKIEEARAAYEAALGALKASDQQAVVDAAKDKLAEVIYEDAVSRLDEKYDLIYVDYNDSLSDDQVAALVSGDTKKLWESLEEWESETRWYGSTDVIDNGLDLSAEDIEILRETDRYDQLRYEIEERDDSDWFNRLVNETSDPLLRICCIEEDDAFSFEPVTPEQVLDKIGFEHSEHNIQVVQETLNECSPEFSVLLGYWLCTIDLKLLADCPDDGSIKITNPTLYLGNPFAGSGWFSSTPLHGEVIVPRSDIRTDKDAFGYSVNEVFGGLNARGFDVQAEIVQ